MRKLGKLKILSSYHHMVSQDATNRFFILMILCFLEFCSLCLKALPDLISRRIFLTSSPAAASMVAYHMNLIPGSVAMRYLNWLMSPATAASTRMGFSSHSFGLAGLLFRVKVDHNTNVSLHRFDARNVEILLIHYLRLFLCLAFSVPNNRNWTFLLCKEGSYSLIRITASV